MTRPALRRPGAARVPLPLLALLLAVLSLGAGWTLVTPAMQAPDERAHVSYTIWLATTGTLPATGPLGPATPTEEALATAASNADRAAMQPTVKMSWDRERYEQWRRDAATLDDAAREDGGALANPAASNPPLYYLTTLPAYLATSGSDLFGRLTAMRLVSVLWLLGTVIAAWLLAGELFGRRRLLQTAVAGFTGLAPMMLFVSGSVTPDAALFATWGLVLWLGTVVLRRGITARRALALCFVLGLAMVVKATSYALVPPVALVLLVGVLRARRAAATAMPTSAADPAPDADAAPAEDLAARDEGLVAAPPTEAATRRGLLRIAGASVLGLLITAGAWIIVSRALGVAALAQGADVANSSGDVPLHAFPSYVWQFYLPRLPFMDPAPGIHAWPAWEFFVEGAWGAFGWLEVRFPGWVYVVLTALMALLTVLAARGLWRERRTHDWLVPGFYALVAVLLLGALHWTEFHKGGTGFIQGRYLMPLAPLVGAVAVRGLLELPKRWLMPSIAVGLGGLVVLNLLAWGLMLERFYA
ncbi:MAG: DUF2142 domain-containing protein [Patulibacter sp.]|nr:DUF2142 domain-containing protein [Patulibacter sp.]